MGIVKIDGIHAQSLEALLALLFYLPSPESPFDTWHLESHLAGYE
jgi:hypothetical protein